MIDAFIERLSRKYPNLARVLKDSGNRAALFLAISLAATLLFAVYNGVLAIVYKSTWNIALGGYYTLLLASKIGLLLGFGNAKRREENAELHGALTYLISGAALFLLHTPLVILVIETRGNAFRYAGVLIYFYAAYAFYKIIAAVVNLVRSYKHRSGLVTQAIRNINLADAMVSVLALQTALISTFGGEGMPHANIATGGVICGIVMLGSIFMCIRASVLLVRIRREKSGREQ